MVWKIEGKRRHVVGERKPDFVMLRRRESGAAAFWGRGGLDDTSLRLHYVAHDHTYFLGGTLPFGDTVSSTARDGCVMETCFVPRQ